MDTNIFVELIEKSGLTLRNKKNAANILNCDQAVFQQNLRAAILVYPRLDKKETIACFINDLEKHLEDELNLKSSLLYTQTSQTCSTCRGGQQDSLIRILLNIDELQSKTISLLIEKLLQIIYENEETYNIDIARLILANLRWLDHIVDSSSLTEKVIDLLHGSPLEIQKEIIGFLPNIIDGENHFKVAEILRDLYESTSELTCSILDTLTYLLLEPNVLSNIHNSVLEKLHTVKPGNLPVVIKFLLNNTAPNVANKVVANIRATIPLPCKICSGSRALVSDQLSLSNDDKYADTEMLMFSSIKTTSLIHKYLGGAWLKAVSDVSEKKFIKHFDFLVLMTIYQHIPSRRNGIESIIRNMIRLNLFTTLYLESTFHSHSLLIKECFEAIKKLADQLLRSPESEISHYGADIYRCSFVCLGPYHQEEIILSLLSHLGDNESVRQTSLSLLSLLAHQYPDMENFLPYLKGSLDIMETLSLREAKLLMDVLLHLAYSNPNETSSKDELIILIKKQLSHSNIKFKRLGVLSAVLTLKNSVKEKEDTSNAETANSNSESGIKEAEALFNAVRESTVNSPYSSALFMDELATSILKSGFSVVLEKWISEKIIGDFEESFIVDCDLTSTDNFLCPVAYQWNLDDVTDSEKTKSIAVSITKLVLENLENADKECSPNIVTLAPHFRLMRMVESHLHEGDLGNIDALLGCGLQMPSPSGFEKFSSLTEKEQTMLLTCLFYAINWCRELVNAFATQKDKDLRRKVVLRLRKIISLQDLLLKLLHQKPSYTPPPAMFDLDIKIKFRDSVGSEPNAKQVKGNKGKKRKLSELNDTSAISQSQNYSQKPKTTSALQENNYSDLKNYKAFLRELHLDVFNLLFRNLCLDSELNEENTKYLYVSEARFLISDLNEKFARIFGSETKKISLLAHSHIDQDVGFSHFDVFDAQEVAEQAFRYIKPICAHLEVINHFFQKFLCDDDDENDDLSVSSEQTAPVSKLYSSLFTTLRLLLSWPSLHLSEQSNLLTNILKLFGKKLEGNRTDNMSKEELVSSSFRYFSPFSDSVISIETAVELVQLLDALIAFSDNKPLKEKLFKVIDKFLRKKWDPPNASGEKGPFARGLLVLLKIYFCHCDDPLSVVHSITNEGVKEVCESTSKDSESSVYPTLRISTLKLYYGVLLKNLVSGTKKLLEMKSNSYDHLEIWNLSVKTLYLLIEPVKNVSLAKLYSSCLQHCKKYLELFLQEGMPLLDKCLQKYQKEVTALLKNLQLTTRFLHHLCTHVKSNQDSRLVCYVPFMKRSLETIVFRVKAMLTLNDCQSAFWLGNLKNRDLQGEELLSQSTATEEVDNEEPISEEVLSDVELDEENERIGKEREESYSISY